MLIYLYIAFPTTLKDSYVETYHIDCSQFCSLLTFCSTFGKLLCWLNAIFFGRLLLTFYCIRSTEPVTAILHCVHTFLKYALYLYV